MNRIYTSCCLTAVAAFTVAGGVATIDETRTGSWMGNFAAATNLSIQAHAPLILFWGNYGCSHCADLEKAVETSEFRNWQSKYQDYVYCFVQGARGKDRGVNENSGAMRFAATAGGTAKSLSSYPFVTLYWPKQDGTLYARRFVGRDGSMSGAANGRSLARQLSDAIDDAFSSYTPYLGPDAFSFTVSNTGFDRLEAEPSTPYVDVPLSRDVREGGTATNLLISIWPDSILPAVTNIITWMPTETKKMCRVNLARGVVPFPEGKKLALALLDGSGAELATSAIHCVAAQASSIHNPKFVGEDFAYGEWTMDYEAAKKKPGYVLANFSGGLWCPDCNGIDSTLLADPRFTEWAASNKIYLVLFDQGQSSSPATAAGNGKARLLTYTAGPSYFRDGRPMTSGASYLSRKAISSSAAAARIAMTTRLTNEWLSPDSTAARLGNPTLLLVKDDKVMGRANLHVDGYMYDPAENIGRLAELLSLADGKGESDNYAETTSRRIYEGMAESVSFQINDRSECFRITEAEAGVWRFALSDATADVDVTVSVCTGNVAIASGVGAVTTELTGAVFSADPYVRLAAYPSNTDRVCAHGESTSFTASLTAIRVAPPTETDPHKLNPYLGKKRAKQIIPLLAETSHGKVLAGTLSVSITAKGKITTKYTGTGAGAYSFSGTWQDQDRTDGTLSSTFKSGDARLTIALAADGTLSVTMAVPTAAATCFADNDELTMAGSAGISHSGAFDAFAGCYTVQMPAISTDDGGDMAGGVSLTLKMTSSSAIKQGKMKYSAVLPNGKTLSGTSLLEMRREIDGNGLMKECAWLPIFKHTSKQVFAVLLRLSPNGSATWDAPTDAEGLDVVETADGSIAYCLMRGKIDLLSTHGVYGSWFKAGITPKALCERFALGEMFHAVVAADGITSERYGACIEAPSVVLKASGKKFATTASVGVMKISSYAAKAGMVKGKGKLKFEAKTVTGNFAGVVMPGWIDCQCGEGFVERPFAAGSFWFTDYLKRSGRWTPVVRSVPFEIEADLTTQNKER